MTAQDLAFTLVSIGGVPVAIEVYQEFDILAAIGTWLGVFFVGGFILTLIFGLFSRSG